LSLSGDAFAAVGYEYTLCEKGSRQDDATRIMDSLERGVPVLAFQVVGPSDCCIITGYDDGGEVLLGWSTFQDIPDDHNIPHDATGYFRKPGWHENLGGYILIGVKVKPPPLRDIYLDALTWVVHLLRIPEIGNKHTGLAGLRTWAEEMTQEKYFPVGDEQLLGQRYEQCDQCNLLTIIVRQRHFCGRYQRICLIFSRRLLWQPIVMAK
jgi:hypothetical protein